MALGGCSACFAVNFTHRKSAAAIDPTHHGISRANRCIRSQDLFLTATHIFCLLVCSCSANLDALFAIQQRSKRSRPACRCPDSESATRLPPCTRTKGWLRSGRDWDLPGAEKFFTRASSLAVSFFVFRFCRSVVFVGSGNQKLVVDRIQLVTRNKQKKVCGIAQ